MDFECLSPDTCKKIEEIVGYLNFSSGSPDPRFLQNINHLFGCILAEQAKGSPGAPPDVGPAWRVLGRVLRAGLEPLRCASEAFRHLDQAEAVLGLVFEALLPAYRRFHADLLFHQTDEALFQPFFLGRACEAVLAQGPPWEESERIVGRALARLNDFVGHRPVAVLHNRQKLQPYAHEWVRPIPLFIQQAGVAVGRYHDVVQQALQLLGETDDALLRQAHFDPALLDELAVDPRAHDFDHPVNRRPNYHFGTWDPHLIDNRGYYRRFVLQQVTLDALLERAEVPGELPPEEALFEAAAVLAGTMLMGSGVSGSGPNTHDSSVTLASLLPRIAAYRDAFYERLFGRMKGAHAVRLKAEAEQLRQPFGGARQHLNRTLARRRAEQLQRVHLARLFARMGYTDAALGQVRMVPVPSARMRCEMDCRLTTAHLRADRGELDEAAALLPEVEDLLGRAIECGALVDPWNILGFGAQFSLFPAVENTVHDHRVDELIELVNEIFALYARLEKEAAAAGKVELRRRLSVGLEALARWWDQYASTEVSEIEGISGAQAWESAEQVSGAVRAWHEAGTASGDIGFWRQHVEKFQSPKAYALLVETLLEQRDLVASMALLMHWLSQAVHIRLAEGRYSFHDLAVRWLVDLWRKPTGRKRAGPVAGASRWTLTRKFFEHLEANAEDFWQVPQLEVKAQPAANGPAQAEQEPNEEAGGLYGAAYEDVTYRDTTDDGFDADMLEGGPPVSDFELAAEAERIGDRLALLTTVARLWKLGAVFSLEGAEEAADRQQAIGAWLAQASQNRRRLEELLEAVHRYPIAAPRGTYDALLEYDRRRAIKEALLDRVIAACVETADAARVMAMAVPWAPTESDAPWEEPAVRVFRSVLAGDAKQVRRDWPRLLKALAKQPLLYIPTVRGGKPQRIVASRNVQQVLRRLLACLPRLGLLTETYQLIGTIRDMEWNHRVGAGAITEFDRLFEIGCRAIVECLVVSCKRGLARSAGARPTAEQADRELIDLLEQATDRLLHRWLEHSRNIRISVLETVADRARWRALKHFVQRYGHDVFTQKFLTFGNLRAILQQGVGRYLDWLQEEPGPEEADWRLLADLDGPLLRDEAVQWLEIVLEAICENYSEYVDYNSTTTQSDRGEMLYTLLDFLRLEASYDRVAWNLKPVVTAHQVLVRGGRNHAARLWRRAVAQRTAPVADEHLQRLDLLSRQYGMRLPTVADRLGERFVRPLAIDRLCALVRPAMEELRRGRPPAAFRILEREVASLAREPGGVGFDVPSWLEALEEEWERLRWRAAADEELPEFLARIPQVRLSAEQIHHQIARWGRR